jgi:hypothetical protein
MKRWFVSLLLALFAVSNCAAQSDVPQAAPAAPARASSDSGDIKGAFPAMLVKGLDSKKLKEGDAVVCQTVAAFGSRGGLLIPSGSKVYGHVTQATARSKSSPDSTLAMVFDKIAYGKGKELTMKGTLQAVGPSLGDSGPTTGAAGSNVLMGGHSGPGPAGSDNPGGSSIPGGPSPMSLPQASGTASRPLLVPTSKGVVGVKNISLDANGVLSSPGKEVRLDNGTQMLIHAEINVPPR